MRMIRALNVLERGSISGVETVGHLESVAAGCASLPRTECCGKVDASRKYMG